MRNASLAFLFAASLGCGGETLTGPGRTREGLLLAVYADRGEIVAGETVWIVVTLSNPTGREVTLGFGSDCTLLYAIENSAGAAVETEGGGFACLPDLTQLNLAPGETKLARYRWTGRHTLYPPLRYEPLPEGSYKIYGVLEGFGEKRPEARSVPTTVILRWSRP